jgi:zinc protease
VSTAEPDRTAPPAPRPLRPFEFPPIRQTRLGNGLEVIVAEKRDLPIATLDLVLPCGGTAEPGERAGIAGMTAGLLESGAAGRDAAAIAEEIDGLGVSLEAGSSWDATVVGFTALASRLDGGAAILADLVTRPAFPEGEVERIRETRIAALSQRRADPAGLADELLAHFTFAAGHPFARRLGGLRSTLAATGRGDVATFHDARYRPAGAALCAAGDVSLEEVVSIAERHLGGWAGAPPPVPGTPPTRRFERMALLLADRPGAVQSEVRIGHIGLERSAADYVPTVVMNAILGGLFSSRLNLVLREKLGYTYGVHSAFAPRRAAGSFAVSSALQVEGTADAVARVLAEMRALQEAVVTPAELDDARSYLAGVFPLTLQTTDAIAGRLAALHVHDLEPDHWDRYRDRLMAVDAAAVQAAARDRLHPDRAVVVVVGDADRLRGPLEAELGVEATTIDAEHILR